MGILDDTFILIIVKQAAHHNTLTHFFQPKTYTLTICFANSRTVLPIQPPYTKTTKHFGIFSSRVCHNTAAGRGLWQLLKTKTLLQQTILTPTHPFAFQKFPAQYQNSRTFHPCPVI